MNVSNRVAIIWLVLALPLALGAGTDQATKEGKNSETPPAQTVPQAAGADQGKDQQPGAAQTKGQASSEMPVYKPPLRGSPGGRVGGGTRGLSEKEGITLQVLAPDHVGLTRYDQPRLYWYISAPVSYPIEFTLIEQGAVKPLVEKRLGGIEKAGIHCIRLADYGVRLRRDVLYKWFVTILIDPDRRSRDIVAGGVIEYAEPTPTLIGKLKEAGSEKAPHVLAGEGLWYDAFALISDRVEASPDNMEFRKQQASMLQQVGLQDIAAYKSR
jgi:hypothetical protein